MLPLTMETIFYNKSLNQEIAYSDDSASLSVFRDAVAAIKPDVLQVFTPEAPFDKALGLPQDRLEAIAGELQKSLGA